MIELKGYQLKETIREGVNSTVFRGLRVQDHAPVIIKWHYADEANAARKQRALKNEYEIMELLSLEGTVKAVEMIETRDGCGLAMEDFGGRSLRDELRERKQLLELETFLKMAVNLTDTLGRVHQLDVIHKDINPGNIIVNSGDWTVKLADFGIASLLGRDVQAIISPERLEGTLAYISPEQTGRMNRSIDYRTDIYSLGVTFYECLCGDLPFQARDAVGWVHNHIAVNPTPPHEKNPQTPAILSRIIMKMMEKNAEDRYRSAHGVKADLEECLGQLKERGKMDDFEPGQKDVSGRFQIPQKLYGREKETKILLNHFDASVELGTSEMLLVAGYSGIGKSVLVREIHKPILERRGYFVSGKYDQLNRNIPFSAIIQAFQELVYQLVSESEEHLKDWKAKILEALGPNGRVIIDIIPDVELIIGKQPTVAELGPAESQARFDVTFRKFIGVFTRKEHPLVIFVDDLQWADSASLNFLSRLVSDPDSKYLFLIGAYRDNEVNATHPFMLMLDEVKKGGGAVSTVSLTPLKEEHVQGLTADSLQAEPEEVLSLAKLVMNKTEGNPFFINEFLKTLYREGLLRFDLDRMRWTFNAEEINAQGITGNVVELMVGRMEKLPEGTQVALQMAACIGANFDLKTLSLVSENTAAETAGELWPAIQEGMLIPRGETRELIKGRGLPVQAVDTSRALKAKAKFLHDRVQQAAYAMIDENQKGIIHLKIGRLLLENLKAEELDERLFEVVGQFNDGLDLLTDKNEKLKLAELNLQAGIRAKDATAYQSSLEYFRTGMKLLGSDSWAEHYELTLELYRSAADAAYLGTELEVMEEFAAVVLKNARTLLEKMKVYDLRILTYINRYELLNAISAGIEVLGLLGVTLPKKPILPNVMVGLVKTKLALRGKNSETLFNLPPMQDPYKLAAMKILALMFTAAYWASPLLLPLLVFQLVQLSIKYGNSPASCFGYVLYGGAALCGQLKDFDGGYEMGKLAVRLAERPESREFQAKTIALAHFFIGHHKTNIPETIKPIEEAYQIGLETGDLEWSSHCGVWATIYTFLTEPLPRALEKAQFYGHALEQFKQKTPLNYVRIHHQAMFLLTEAKSENPSQLKGGIYDEESMLSLHQEKNDNTAVGFLFFNKLNLAYLFEQYESALEFAAETEKCLEGGLLALIEVPYYYFYDSLTRLALLDNVSNSSRRKYLKVITKNQKSLKHYMNHVPETYVHKFALVEAELARVRGEERGAMKLYENAIRGAREGGFLQEEALANQLLAKFWITRNWLDYAVFHMTEARRLYRRWGAVAMVQHLDETYPGFIGRERVSQKKQKALESSGSNATTLGGDTTQGGITTTTSVTSSTTGGTIDLGTVVKATRTMAGEIKLSLLLGTMMEIVLENAGARRGFLFLEREGELMLASRRYMDQDVSENMLSLPLAKIEEQGGELAASVVRYVARTQESLVISDASNDENFSRDPYISEHKPRSILCSPIIHQGHLTGLLYLENNLSAGAFTQQRLEVLNMLSSQAAVSLENAVLYDNMESNVEERTKEVRDILTNVKQGIFTINRDYYLTGGFSGMVPKIFEGVEFIRAQPLIINELVQHPKLEEFLELLFTSPFVSLKIIESANPLKITDYHFVDSEGREFVKKLSFIFSRIFETDSEGNETKVVQKLMVVVDDRTEEFELKQELKLKQEEQAGKVEKLYQILQLEPSVFSNFISESAATLNEVHSQLLELGDEPEKNKDVLRIIFREVHTLKGNARALSLDSIGKTAHELEDVFEELKENPERITQELKDKTNAAVTMLKNEIQDGNSLFEKILNMQNSLQSAPKDAMGEFAERLRNIVKQESEAAGKDVEFEFINEPGVVPSDVILKKLRNPLSHIVRNSVSHGIEDTVLRQELQKNEKGRITLRLSRQDGNLMLVCRDDGGGLDVNKIRSKAEKMKLYTAEELRDMNEKDVCKLIFSSGLTTKDAVSDSAGRGVGMDAVREELREMKAAIGVSTKANQYTKFVIRVPEG